MKRTLRIGLIATLGLAAAAVFFAYFLNWNQLRPLIARKSKQYTGRELLISGDLRLNWSWSPTISAENVTFENASWAPERPLFQAARVEISVSLLRLFKIGRAHV